MPTNVTGCPAPLLPTYKFPEITTSAAAIPFFSFGLFV
jgi:hypothetical protein